MRKDRQMTLSDRLVIEVGIERGESFKRIAKRLGRHPSAIAHEVKENRTYIQGYYPGAMTAAMPGIAILAIFVVLMAIAIHPAEYVNTIAAMIIVTNMYL